MLKQYPLGLIYFNRAGKDRLEVLDGQQRITSVGRFVTNKFAITDAHGMQQYFGGLANDRQRLILDSMVLVYECDGTESEIKEWFKTINTEGVPLNDQELLNAIYSGPFVTAGKAEFSNSQNSNTQKWSAYIKGSARRQDFWERALDWVSKGDIDAYMSQHRSDSGIADVKTYFNTVIDWVASLFVDVEKEMCGLEWGRLYEAHHSKPYDPTTVDAAVKALYADPYVKNRKGIFEYVLAGSVDTNLLDVRVFDEATKKATYSKQTKDATKRGNSNCPLCAVGTGPNATKIWSMSDMEADHVDAWSKGGATTASNCQMLCKTHNRAKGNR